MIGLYYEESKIFRLKATRSYELTINFAFSLPAYCAISRAKSVRGSWTASSSTLSPSVRRVGFVYTLEGGQHTFRRNIYILLKPPPSDRHNFSFGSDERLFRENRNLLPPQPKLRRRVPVCVQCLCAVARALSNRILLPTYAIDDHFFN